jgi:oxygen-independent coproporphyrinogen-3 oxidase
VKGEAVDHEWIIPREELGFEFMMNALRLTDGVPLSLLVQRTGLSSNALAHQLSEAEKKGLLTQSLDTQNQVLIQPTILGQRFLNELLQIFL